eukprot:TRINITY_DN36214_c0_g1_i1.p2 TRINITY_DN36214_c0_g1~~TRINITY_DN36214_c0_g1_i1.p2  ORF type:complete len:128 (-),score=14.89 TRINITY_DN36214_c0_g1_i1:113-496(-)
MFAFLHQRLACFDATQIHGDVCTKCEECVTARRQGSRTWAHRYNFAKYGVQKLQRQGGLLAEKRLDSVSCVEEGFGRILGASICEEAFEDRRGPLENIVQSFLEGFCELDRGGLRGLRRARLWGVMS